MNVYSYAGIRKKKEKEERKKGFTPSIKQDVA